MRALIDGDIIVYWASNHCQTNYYNVVDKNGDNIKEYDSKRHAMDGLEDINALWSTQSKVGEISPYTIVQGKTVLEPWSENTQGRKIRAARTGCCAFGQSKRLFIG